MHVAQFCPPSLRRCTGGGFSDYLPDPNQLFGIAGRITRNVNRLIVQVQYRVRYIGITQLGLTAHIEFVAPLLAGSGPWSYSVQALCPSAGKRHHLAAATNS
jgi:hypothetical protein